MRPGLPSEDAPMPTPLYATCQRLRHTIAKRIWMSHFYQPLMLQPTASAKRLELLGHGFPRQQPARPRRRTWPG